MKAHVRLIRAAFGQRRKLLVNAVSNAGIGYSKEALLHALRRMGIAENARGEQLGVDNYARMADILLSESP
jgi:16S rRNA (adenine1518-N6/adenine1519-N6)-dimethyltransferase